MRWKTLRLEVMAAGKKVLLQVLIEPACEKLDLFFARAWSGQYLLDEELQQLQSKQQALGFARAHMSQGREDISLHCEVFIDAAEPHHEV
jgi:hypothetical protein